MALAWFVARHAVDLAILAATAWAAGRLGLRALRLDAAGVPGAFVLAVGLMILAQASMGLGLVGLLRAPVVAGLVAGVHLAAWAEWRRWLARLAAAPPRPRLAWIAGGVLALPLFLIALYPPLGFDETLYHLPTARAFAASGSLPFLPALRYPVFPHLAEALHASILLLAGDVATHLAGWLGLVVTIGLAASWARAISTPAGGWLAAAMLAGSPIAWYLAASGYVEPFVALSGLASLYAADRSRRDPGIGWLLAGAALAGTAAGTKYLGLYFVPAAALVALATRQSPAERLRRLAIYGLAALAALAPAYGRLIALTGNPLFPFYPDLFGASPWAAQEFLGRRGLDRLAAASTLVWDMTFRRHLVGGLPPFSPAFALGVPVVAWAAWRDASVRWLAGLTLAYVALAPVHAHYTLAIAPVWCIAVAVSLAPRPSRSGAEVTPRYPGAVVAVAIALALMGEAYAVHRIWRLGPPPVTGAARDRLLTVERPLYPAVQRLNAVAADAVVYGVGAEDMVAYRTAPLLGDHNGPVSHHRMEARVQALGSVAAALREIGAGYLLLRRDRSVWTAWAAADPGLLPIYEDPHATVYRVR